jgi:hypothetical protein
MQDLSDVPEEKKRSLRILNELATILVRDHEIVAIVCRNSKEQHLRCVATLNPRAPNTDADPCDAMTFKGNTTILTTATPVFDPSNPLPFLRNTRSVQKNLPIYAI